MNCSRMEVFDCDGGYVVTRIWCNYTKYCWTCVGFANTEAEQDSLMSLGKVSRLGGNAIRVVKVVATGVSMGLFGIATRALKVINQTLLSNSDVHVFNSYRCNYAETTFPVLLETLPILMSFPC